MNKHQNAGENCAFFQCRPCRGYSYVSISQDIRSSSLTCATQQFLKLLQNSKECTGGFFQPATFNFIQLSVSFVKFLETHLFWKTSCELVLKGQFYEKWRTDIFIIIKRHLEVDSSFKKQTLRGKVDIREPFKES